MITEEDKELDIFRTPVTPDSIVCIMWCSDDNRPMPMCTLFTIMYSKRYIKMVRSYIVYDLYEIRAFFRYFHTEKTCTQGNK